MDKKPQTSSTYDDMFSSGGHGGVFDLPYHVSAYYPMYREVLRQLRLLLDSERILEVGCGTGAFSEMIFEKTKYQYKGFDFSPVAVKKARQRTGQYGAFFVADAMDVDVYKKNDFDVIVCTEVLEHLPDDIGLLLSWPSGAAFVCSVPNFDSLYHERFFNDAGEVHERYGKLLDIKTVRVIKKPILSDNSWKNWLRQMRWSRYNLVRLKELLGLGEPEKVGCWFVFSGVRR